MSSRVENNQSKQCKLEAASKWQCVCERGGERFWRVVLLAVFHKVCHFDVNAHVCVRSNGRGKARRTLEYWVGSRSQEMK